MKILFNIQEDNSDELLKVLGFVDADFDMLQVAPYLRSASRELFELIGKSNYSKAEEAFEGEELDDEFLILCRYAVAINAFRKFAPLLDISFTTQGRAFRGDEHLKPAFEHQIQSSDEAMEKNYYSSLNEIFSFVMNNEDYETILAIEDQKNLFVSNLKTFQKYLNINDSHLLFFKLVPSLQIAENRFVKPRIGNKFQEFFETENTLIKDLICQICIYWAMEDGINKFAVQLFPDGILNKFKASRIDIKGSALYFKEQREILQKELESEMKQFLPTTSPKTLINFNEDDGFVTM